jgi:cohesin domain-containing protein
VRGARQYGIGVILAGALILAPFFASAATLFVSPATRQVSIGQTFSITVRVNTHGVAVNAIEGTLTFNPAVLQVVSLSKTGSIFDVHVQEPKFSNTAGTVQWAGVILNPGFNGESGNLLTVNFKEIALGTGQIAMISGAVLANDGSGTNVLTGMSGGTYTIVPAPVADATPTITIGEGVSSAELGIPASGTPPILIHYPGESACGPEGDGFLWKLWNDACVVLSSDWLLSLLLLFNALLLVILLVRAWRMRRPTSPGRGEHRIARMLRITLEDMSDELALLSKVARHRSLYPEEQYLRSKLTQYRKNLKLLLSDTHNRLVKKK